MTRKELASVIREQSELYIDEAERLRSLVESIESGPLRTATAMEIADKMPCRDLNTPASPYVKAWGSLYYLSPTEPLA